MIGAIFNQIRQARARELRELAAYALAEAERQEAFQEEHTRSLKSSQKPRSHRRKSSSTETGAGLLLATRAHPSAELDIPAIPSVNVDDVSSASPTLELQAPAGA
jgi:hypothetical protein